MRICGRCKSAPTKKHFNSKWCHDCAEALKTHPKTTMTRAQVAQARKLIGTMPREEIAARVGVSLSALKRGFRGVRLAYHNKYVVNPKLVRDVCAYYATHSKAETQKRFPGVKVRSIVERYKNFSPKCIKWTDDQLIELAQMAGVISLKAQAKYFDRPRANEGAIKSAWMKRFGSSGGSVNGLSWYMARHFVMADCPRFQTAFWMTATKRKGGTNHHSRWLVTWVDFERHLNPGSPKWLRDCARSMANFQVWLHGTKRPRKKLIEMMGEREL